MSSNNKGSLDYNIIIDESDIELNSEQKKKC